MTHTGSSWLSGDVCSPRRLSEQFSLDDLPEQFVLADEPAGPASWPQDKIGGWVLSHHATLPRITLRSTNGDPVGWLLGYPISADGVLLPDGSLLGSVPSSGPALHDWLADFGGRWIAVIADGPEPSVYLDPTGSLAAVYSPLDRIVASTPNLVPYRTGREDNVGLIRATGIPWEDAEYPLDLTPRHGVRRLLPNHHLQLSTFRAERHWPAEAWTTDPDIDTAVARIAELTKRNVRAIVNTKPSYLPLTAGRDSRMLLACARDVLSDLAFYTVPMPDRQADLDTRVASRMSTALGLDHRVVAYQQPQQHDLDEWMFRISCGVGETRGWNVSTTYKTLDPKRPRLVASLGEIARNEYWRPTDSPETPITPERLLGHCHVAVTDETWDAAARWLADVPTSDSLQILTLFFIEHGMGGWAGQFPYADYAGPGFLVFPMNHQEIVRRMISLPVQMQRAGTLPRAVIEREWPELLEWPFNREYGVRRVHRALERRAIRWVRRQRAA
jgi:hypothetical protein